MNGWQPIETAPRDGTWVLLYFPTYKQDAVSAYRFHDILSNGFPWESFDGWGEDVGGDEAPSHWMPLPAAPDAA